MSRHAVVQTGSAGDEAFGFGVVLTEDEAHKFVHEVAMKPWWTEGVFGDDPARRENDEVAIGGARNFGRRGEHGVDGRIGMIERDRVDAIEPREIIFIRRVIA